MDHQYVHCSAVGHHPRAKLQEQQSLETDPKDYFDPIKSEPISMSVNIVAITTVSIYTKHHICRSTHQWHASDFFVCDIVM